MKQPARLLPFVLAACASSGPATKPAPVDNQADVVSTDQPASLAVRIVDNGAPFMATLFARVIGDPPRVVADPNAAALGVRATPDAWATDDGQRFFDYYLYAPERAALEQYLAEFAAKDPAFAVPADREIGYERVSGNPTVGGAPFWRTYYLARSSAASEIIVADATVATDPQTGRPIVMVDLDRASTAGFTALTTNNVGKKLATMVDGQVMSAPIINGPITRGRLTITMGGDDAAAQQREAEQLAAALKRRPDLLRARSQARRRVEAHRGQGRRRGLRIRRDDRGHQRGGAEPDRRRPVDRLADRGAERVALAVIAAVS